MALLETCALTHHYPGQGPRPSGITDISFTLSRGEFMVLAGRNGSGKTTLIRHLNGLLRPDSGGVFLRGEDIFKDLIHTRKTVGMVFQDADTQIVGDTVFDEVAFGPENLNWDRARIKTEVTRVLKETGLFRFRHRNPATLSGGEKRRLTIAGILVMDPQLIIFDEPFANLDYPAACAMITLVNKLKDQGRTILMATHDVDLVIGLADRLIIMDQGRIAADGPARALAGRLPEFGLKPCCTCRKLSPCFAAPGKEKARHEPF